MKLDFKPSISKPSAPTPALPPDIFVNQTGVTFTRKVVEELGFPPQILCQLDAKKPCVCHPRLPEGRR